MSVLTSSLSTRSAAFIANAQAMQAAVEDLRVQMALSAQGGGESARAKHVARGKLPPRDRVAMLLDPGTPFWSSVPGCARHVQRGCAWGWRDRWHRPRERR